MSEVQRLKSGVISSGQARRVSASTWKAVLSVCGAALVVLVFVWQAIAAQGMPDPAAKGLSRTAIAFSSGVLVFREGLEAVLVLAVVTAGLIRSRQDYWRSVLAGAAAAFLATIVTWFVAVAIIASVNAPMLQIQAATGLLAIAVLLVVMNWFFHKVYWTGWIGHHSARGRNILRDSTGLDAKTFWGLALLGFTAVYREGFEIVLFLQDLRLKAGAAVILSGAGIGLLLTAIVGGLVFSAHRRLPYKKLLVWAGILLGVVLVVMVGESVQEIQLAHWLPTTGLSLPIPGWAGTWFAAFPNLEGLIGQLLAILFVVGPFAWVRLKVRRSREVRAVCPVNAEPLDCVIANSNIVSASCGVCEDEPEVTQSSGDRK